MNRRLKTVAISPEFVWDVIRSFAEDLPEDCQYAGMAQYDFVRDCFDIKVTSETFPEVPQGYVLERLQPMMRQVVDG